MQDKEREITEHNLPTTRCCIIFATADWDEPYWTNKQHCAKTLASLGIEVLYVESIGLRSPKTKSIKDVKRIISRIKKSIYSYLIGPMKRSEAIYVASPVALPGTSSLSFRIQINTWLLDFLIKKSVKKLGFRNVLIWAYHPYIGNCRGISQVTKTLYHCVDDLSSVPGIDAEAFRIAESRFLQSVDCCYVTSQNLLKRCLPYNSETKYLPNVVDTEHFFRDGTGHVGLPAPLRVIPRPRIVYHGVLSDFKVDFRLLLECAILRPGWNFVVIGEEREGQKDLLVQKLRQLENTHFLGYVRYNDIPEYLNSMDVGILPSLINRYTASMFPMKFFEYIASGLPVVSTPLDFAKSVRGGILISEDSQGFVDAITAQLYRGRLSQDESERIISGNTWRSRTLNMLNSLEM